ncbi:MAG: hypothetical protein HC838_17425 [Spirulinaceae cyanobacterium RM2_2_10]|nr:hypothetical protein [Spirulinaceae cyanobacterium RM2_2_10]
MPKQQKSEALVLGIAILLTGGILAGGGWWAQRAGLLPGSGSGGFTTTQANNPNINLTLKALGDTFSGYSTLRSEAFQASLAERGIGLAYGDEFKPAGSCPGAERGQS